MDVTDTDDVEMTEAESVARTNALPFGERVRLAFLVNDPANIHVQAVFRELGLTAYGGLAPALDPTQGNG